MNPLLPNAAAFLLAILLLHGAKAEWTETAKLLDSDGVLGDWFGFAVAMDNGIAVVGAWSDGITDGATTTGSASIFELTGDDTWSNQQKLVASDAEAGAYFGFAVAISNETVAVGAPLKDNGLSSNVGAVYIFGKEAGDGSWTEQQKLLPSDAESSSEAYFGWSLAMQGHTLILGAPAIALSSRGSAYVYTLAADGSVWTEQAQLTPSDGFAGDEFGYAVAFDGETETTLVGARFVEDDLGVSSGSAYVFRRQGEGDAWTQQAKLTSTDGQSGDWFGFSVALEGNTICVGSRNNADGDRVGAVYVFGNEEDDTWTQQSKLVANDFTPLDYFGLALAFRDGTLVVGAFGKDSSVGAVYVFRSTVEGVWTQAAKLVASDGVSDDRFGYAVDVEEEMVMVGAYGDNSFQGSVYAFEWRASESPSIMPSVGLSQEPTTILPPTNSPSKIPTEPPSAIPTLNPSEQPSSLTPTNMSVPFCPSGLIRCAFCVVFGIFCLSDG